MTRAAALLLLLLGCGAASAQETQVFTPPQAYPADRYEAMWGKNPFTLKTAPAVVENVSFAKDLAIGSHYGDTENPTIVVVNTKTHERTRLRKGETAPNGMRLASVKIGATRKETTVEVTLGSETTELTYNSEYLSQVAATKSAKTPAAGRPGMPGAAPVPGAPVNNIQQMQRGPGVVPPTVRMPGAPPTQRPSPAGVSAAGVRNGASPAGMAVGGVPSSNVAVNAVPDPSVNLNVSTGGQAPVPQNSPLVSQAGNAPPVPVRRRMISPAANDALPQ